RCTSSSPAMKLRFSSKKKPKRFPYDKGGKHGLSNISNKGPVDPIPRQRPANAAFQRKRTLLLPHSRKRSPTQLPTESRDRSFQMLCLRPMGIPERPRIPHQPLFFSLLNVLSLHSFPALSDPEVHAIPPASRIRAGAIPC